MERHRVRFGGLGRLYSTEGLERLRQAHVCVIGIGGVGSWAVESLARSGVGHLTLVDLDDVCVRNVNRQLHALEGEFGKPKVEVMAQRVRAINPDGNVEAVQSFFTRTTAPEILKTRFDYVLDAMDSPSKKCLLIALCREKSIPVITTGAAAGRRDPTAIRISDLAATSHDRLLQEVRKKLRLRHGFPREQAFFGVPSVFSTEPPICPAQEVTAATEHEGESDLRLDCDTGYGTASFVTGTFGLVAAAHIVSALAQRGGTATAG